MWHFLSKWQAFITPRRLMFFTSTRADAEIIFLAYLPAGLSILNSSPTTNSSSSRWPWDSPKTSVKPVAAASSYSFFWGTGDSYGRWLQLAWLPVPQGGAVEMLGHLPFLCSQHLSRAWSLERWHPMTLPMFPVGSARKLQQKRCRSKGTDNEKQGEESFGGFKGTNTMPTRLGASQLQTCRLINTRLLNNCSTTTFKLKKKKIKIIKISPSWQQGSSERGAMHPKKNSWQLSASDYADPPGDGKRLECE